VKPFLGPAKPDLRDNKIFSICVWGMSTRGIGGHLREPYGTDVSPDLVSTVTDAVLDEVAAWRQRPLDQTRERRTRAQGRRRKDGQEPLAVMLDDQGPVHLPRCPHGTG
jgi:hypothetical protein